MAEQGKNSVGTEVLLDLSRFNWESPKAKRFIRKLPWAIKLGGTRVALLDDKGEVERWYGRRPVFWKRAYYRARMWLA